MPFSVSDDLCCSHQGVNALFGPDTHKYFMLSTVKPDSGQVCSFGLFNIYRVGVSWLCLKSTKGKHCEAALYIFMEKLMMKARDQIVGTAVVAIDGQGVYLASKVNASFEGTSVSLSIELDGPPRLIRTFKFVFPDRSAHLNYQEFNASYTDNDLWNHYKHVYEPVAGGADTMIDNEGIKVRGAFNMKMKLTEDGSGAGHPEIVVHGWFDLPNPSRNKADHT